MVSSAGLISSHPTQGQKLLVERRPNIRMERSHVAGILLLSGHERVTRRGGKQVRCLRRHFIALSAPRKAKPPFSRGGSQNRRARHGESTIITAPARRKSPGLPHIKSANTIEEHCRKNQHRVRWELLVVVPSVAIRRVDHHRNGAEWRERSVKQKKTQDAEPRPPHSNRPWSRSPCRGSRGAVKWCGEL